MIGQRLAHYEILEKIGAGGMGVVYKARDTHLDRFVAVKVLPAQVMTDSERKRRFVQEARAASALNHPNIITIHDIDSADGVDFMVMEHVDGTPLDRQIAGRRLPLAEALGYAVEIADALAAAHAAGIVHRDVKPANIMVGRAGHVKVLDFGLAKLMEQRGPDDATLTAQAATRPGAIVGTAAYMSPEQAEGRPVDARSDVFSFGAVLYELLAGSRPFQGESHVSTLAAILRDPPAPLESARPDVPPELKRIVLRCLEKNREGRYPSARELCHDLAACQTRLSAPEAGLRALLGRPRVAIPALVVLLAVLAGGTWFWARSARVRWAREVALPEAGRLAQRLQFNRSLRLIRQAERYVPDDPQLRQLRDITSAMVSVRTTPPGAEVSVRDYADTEDAGAWELLGRSPLDNVRMPTSYLRWRVTKPGFEPLEAASDILSGRRMEFALEPAGGGPPGMVRVLAGQYQLGGAAPVELQEYRLDKYEVTNRQFKEFIDRGGYQKRDYWKNPFVKNGRTLSWEQAMSEFRDATGRPGPSTWELGTFPDGQAEFPVSGVSWYEAAAYAAFAGKSLPTVYHWFNAAGTGIFSDILPVSNFGSRGPARVGSYQGLGPYGTYDMAGNVKEWCWNQAGDRRYILGGAWSEPPYMFTDLDAQSPFDRSATYGFRCARYSTPPPAALTGPFDRPYRDYSREKPVSDEVFRLYKSIFSYDRGELNSRIESVDESHPHWRKEKVSFNAAYGNERVTAYLFLPRNWAAPYQTVIYFPGSDALDLRSSEHLPDVLFFEFIVRSGRAVLFPIYKGTYERHVDLSGPNAFRDVQIQWAKDFSRSIDYLEIRKEIDRERLAFYGLSMGANRGPLLTALEGRLKASVLLAGGFPPSPRPPEVDAINFAPRVRTPTLMLNGRYDFDTPFEACALPMFRFLGVPAKDKRHVIFPSGHIPAKMQDVIKETLDWLDRYLGPVNKK